MEIEGQTKNLLSVAQQKQNVDHHQLTQEKQDLEKEENRMGREQAFIVAELVEDNRRSLAAATLTELELSVLEFHRSLREALPELSAHGQSVRSVWLTNWPNYNSTEFSNDPN